LLIKNLEASVLIIENSMEDACMVGKFKMIETLFSTDHLQDKPQKIGEVSVLSI
jgi:hypothetical protein